jgi:hypothetical protein
MNDLDQVLNEAGSVTLDNAGAYLLKIERYLFSLITPYTAADQGPHGGEIISEPEPRALKEAVRRLLTRLTLARLRGFESLTEFRQDLQTQLKHLLATADETAKYSARLIAALKTLKSRLDKATVDISADTSKVESYLRALSQTNEQANALKNAFPDTGSFEALYLWLAPCMGSVLEVWSTLWKQLEKPVKGLAIGVLGGLIAYAAIGSLVPSQVLSLLIPVIATLGVVLGFITRNMRITNDLKLRKRLLASINPDETIGTAFWRGGEAPETIMSRLIPEINKNLSKWHSLERILRRRKQVELAKTAIALLFLAMIAFVYVVVLLISPRYDVLFEDGQQSERVAASGKIVWAGPGDVIVYESPNNVSIVRSRRVLSIHRSADSEGVGYLPDQCNCRTGSAPSSPSKTVVRMLYPLHVIRIGADEKRWLFTPADPLEIARMFRNWRDECQAVVSVVGEASRKPFPSVDSVFKNQELSAARAADLAGWLGLSPASTLTGQPIFKSLNSDVSDSTEQMARTPFIEISDLNKCQP